MTLENLHGRVAYIFEEDDFDVDQIVGVKNIKIQDLDELAGLAMASYDPDFATQVQPGDVIVGGHNFGFGHPHYPPMKALRHLGVAGVIAGVVIRHTGRTEFGLFAGLLFLVSSVTASWVPLHRVDTLALLFAVAAYAAAAIEKGFLSE